MFVKKLFLLSSIENRFFFVLILNRRLNRGFSRRLNRRLNQGFSRRLNQGFSRRLNRGLSRRLNRHLDEHFSAARTSTLTQPDSEKKMFWSNVCQTIKSTNKNSTLEKHIKQHNHLGGKELSIIVTANLN